MNRTELLKTAKPILFNTEMVRAILDGRKTNTRRIIKTQPPKEWHVANLIKSESAGIISVCFSSKKVEAGYGYLKEKTKYQVGDYLYIRETFAKISDYVDVDPSVGLFDGYIYKADTNSEHFDLKWRPSIHMPKEAARIFLKVTAVRVERLQDITEEQARLEGVNGGCARCGNPAPCGCEEPAPLPVESFVYLWDSVYGWDTDNGWLANPWVWVYEFERVEGTK